MNAEREYIHSLLCSKFRQSPKEPIWAWADKNMSLSAKAAAEMTEYDSSLTPWMREPADLIRDPDVTKCTIMKSSQSGASQACGINVLCWMPEHYNGNALYALNSREKAADLAKKRLLKPLLTHAAAELTADPNDITNLTIRLRSMDIKLAGSGSPSPYRETQYRVAILDEVEDHELIEGQTSIELVDSRFATLSDFICFILGKPQKEGGPIHESFCKGTQERWMIPCARCGERIELKKDHFQFHHHKSERHGWDLEGILNDTWYRCQVCEGKIEEWEKAGMVAEGIWVPREKDDRMRLDDKFIPAEPGHRSFHVTDFLSPFPNVTWGKLFMKLVGCKTESARNDWRKNHTGLPESRKTVRVTKDIILALRGGVRQEVTYTAGFDADGLPIRKTRDQIDGESFELCYNEAGEMINELPCDPAIILISVDKQGDCLKFTVFAYLLDGQSWLIDYGRVHDEYELVKLRKRKYFVPGKERPRYIFGGGIDCGHDRQVVLRWCLKSQALGWNLYPLRGWGDKNPTLRTRAITEKDERTDGGHPIKIYEFHDHTIKYDLYCGYIQKRNEPRLWLPKTVPEDIQIELTSEYLLDGKFIHPKDSDANDYGDCFKMNKCVLWPIFHPKLLELSESKNSR